MTTIILPTGRTTQCDRCQHVRTPQDRRPWHSDHDRPVCTTCPAFKDRRADS